MYKENPKTKGSGIICCIPQKTRCPMKCPDCFFQSGQSYLEPLEDNLPNMPPIEETYGRIVRVNDGNDSGNDVTLVLAKTINYEHRYYNTSLQKAPDQLKHATILTVNPGEITDTSFHICMSPYLMSVRVRANLWNLQLIEKVIDFYALKRNISTILTWMRYPTPQHIPEQYRAFYHQRLHVLNTYYTPTPEAMHHSDYLAASSPLVSNCEGLCKHCGVCLRDYFSWKEKMRQNGSPK